MRHRDKFADRHATHEGAARSDRPAALRRPPLLRPGDRVAMVWPGSHRGHSPTSQIPAAVRLLESWGLAVEPPPAEERRHLYFAGTDAERAEEFQRAYLDEEVRAVFLARGGYGATRLLPLLDSARIAAAPPKPVVGFSDVTALFGYLHKVAAIQCIHGPCLDSPDAPAVLGREENVNALRSLLFDGGYRPAFPLDSLGGGELSGEPVRGPVLGGNLTLWVSLVGTPWQPESAGAILFLEDVNEAPYRVDRMLTQLRQAGQLEGLRAIVFGDLDGCQGSKPGLLEEVLRDLFRDATFPVLGGLPAGHGERNLAFPLGAQAELTAADGATEATGAEPGGAVLRFL